MPDDPVVPSSRRHRCPYTVLGVSRDASFTTIKKAFRQKVLLCHPDKQHKTAQSPSSATEKPSTPAQGTSTEPATGVPRRGAQPPTSAGTPTGAPNETVSTASRTALSDLPSEATSSPPQEEGVPHGDLEDLSFVDVLEAYRKLTSGQTRWEEDLEHMRSERHSVSVNLRDMEEVTPEHYVCSCRCGEEIWLDISDVCLDRAPPEKECPECGTVFFFHGF